MHLCTEGKTLFFVIFIAKHARLIHSTLKMSKIFLYVIVLFAHTALVITSWKKVEVSGAMIHN